MKSDKDYSYLARAYFAVPKEIKKNETLRTGMNVSFVSKHSNFTKNIHTARFWNNTGLTVD